MEQWNSGMFGKIVTGYRLEAKVKKNFGPKPQTSNLKQSFAMLYSLCCTLSGS
jgi:hypothetical protein